MIYWNKLIEDKHEEIEKAISNATRKALKTGNRFVVELDGDGDVYLVQVPARGFYDFGLVCSNLIEIAVIDFRTFEHEGTRERGEEEYNEIE